MPFTVLGVHFHGDLFTVLTIVLIVGYSFVIWHFFKSDKDSDKDLDKGGTGGWSLGGGYSRRTFPRSGLEPALNYSLWVPSKDAKKEGCCRFTAEIGRSKSSPLWYRYGTEAQSCCPDSDGYNGSIPRPLTFLGRGFNAAEFMKTMRGKRIVFMGDSITRQTVTAFICGLEKQGYEPIEHAIIDEPCDLIVKYKGDLELFRVSMTNFENDLMVEWLKKADLLIFNLGAWYRRTQRQHYERDLESVAKLVNQFNAQQDKVAIMVDTLPMHFNTKRHTGDFYDRISEVACVEVDPETYISAGGNWHSRVLRRLSHKFKIPLVEVADIFVPRWDAHLEHRPKYNSKGQLIHKLDCSHWCQRDSLWSPLLQRITDQLHTSMAAGSAKAMAPKDELSTATLADAEK